MEYRYFSRIIQATLRRPLSEVARPNLVTSPACSLINDHDIIVKRNIMFLRHRR